MTPLRNWAISIVLRRYFGLNDNQLSSWEEFYGNILNKNVDLKKYIEQKKQKRRKTIEAVTRNTPEKGRILEAGCGTSALSVWLNGQGYETHSLDSDLRMLDIASKLNKACGTSVVYHRGDLYKMPFPDDYFDTVFSHGVLEHFALNTISNALNEGLRIANTYVFSLPTIFDVSNGLRGDEHLLTYFHWARMVNKSKGYISNVTGSFTFQPKLDRINDSLKDRLFFIAPVLILEVKRKQ